MLELYDVKQEYIDRATPGEGVIVFEDGYMKESHQNEIAMAQWLHSTYGGNVKLLNEKNNYDNCVPDYEWNGKLWDLKNTTTAKSANSALRHGIRQIQGNLGGIILDYKDNEFSMDDLEKVINKRLSASATFMVDIMIIKNSRTENIFRYKK